MKMQAELPAFLEKKDSGWRFVLRPESPEAKEVVEAMLRDNSSDRDFPSVLVLWGQGKHPSSSFSISEGPDVPCSKKAKQRLKFLTI